jgi:hypothetical protein
MNIADINKSADIVYRLKIRIIFFYFKRLPASLRFAAWGQLRYAGTKNRQFLVYLSWYVAG